ncbi:MAG: GumC family protein [Pseudomonadota bacterium]
MLPSNSISPDARDSHLPTAAGGRAVGYPRAPGYPGYPEMVDGADADGFDFRKYLRILVKHRWVILGSLGICLLLSLIATFLMTPIYQATATLQIDREAANVVQVEGLQTSENVGDPQFYQTQYELLQSRALAERAVAAIGLAEDQKFVVKAPMSVLGWIRAAIGSVFSPAQAGSEAGESSEASMEKAQKDAIDALQRGLSVSPIRNSRLVKVTFSHPNPDVALRVANGLAEAFIASNLERKYDASSYARKFLEERLQQLKVKLEESEAQLVAYAQKQGIINLDDRQSLKGNDLASINAKLMDARNERIRVEQLWLQAQKAGGLGLTQILGDPTIQENRKLRSQLAADYQQKLGLYKPAFPAMVRLKAQIQELDDQAKLAATAIKASIKAQFEAAKSAEAELAEQLESTKTDVLDQRSRSIQYNILQREVDTNRTLYDGLLQRYKEIGVAGGVGTNNISVVDRAERPNFPSSPKLLVNMMMALVAGAALGVASAFGLEYMDDTFKSPEDVESSLAMPVVGVIPKPKSGMSVSDAAGDARSGMSEAYRSLRTALQFASADGFPRTLVVTSSRPSEGKSTTCVSLATTLTQIGMKVLLIDADLRNPSLHKYLTLSNEMGLSNYLAGAKLPQDVAQDTRVNHLTFIPAGPLPPNPAELLAGSRFTSLLGLATESFDVVIVDSPPIMGLADAPLLAGVVSGTLLVVAANETRREAAKVAVKRLHFARASIIGAVLSKFDAAQVGYGYGYGYGDYEYQGTTDADIPKLARNSTEG